MYYTSFSFTISAAAAAAAAAVNKDKAWTLGNTQRLKKSSLSSGNGNGNTREKQMPMRPRSVNSTFEKQPRGGGNINVCGGSKILGYATLNDRQSTNNTSRSFHDNSIIGNGGSNYAR